MKKYKIYESGRDFFCVTNSGSFLINPENENEYEACPLPEDAEEIDYRIWPDLEIPAEILE